MWGAKGGKITTVASGQQWGSRAVGRRFGETRTP